jgi:GTP cyclohydrolase IA
MRDGQVRFTEIEEIGDNHVPTSIEHRYRTDAFEIDDELKIELIEKNSKILWKY